MRNDRACRHCGSPARFNPCWWDIKHPRLAESGGDNEAPCFYDLDAEQYNARERRRRHWRDGILIVLAVGFILAIVFWYR